MKSSSWKLSLDLALLEGTAQLTRKKLIHHLLPHSNLIEKNHKETKMCDKHQIRLIFKICQLIDELSSMLWAFYGDAFMELPVDPDYVPTCPEQDQSEIIF